MDAERQQLERARRALEDVSGPVLRATRRGALVLQTENARRMMQRVRRLRPVPSSESESLENPGSISAGP